MRLRAHGRDRRFLLEVAAVVLLFVAFAWVHIRGPFQGVRVLGLAMGAGYALAILAMLVRARRSPEEARGWTLLAVGSLLAALKTLLLTETSGHHLPIPMYRLLLAIGLTLGAASFTAAGILNWPLGKGSHVAGRNRLLNALAGLFTAASMWLLFWMGGTWHEGFRGDTTHHAHLLLLGFQIAATGGVAAFLFLGCPRRWLGPIGIILVGQILLTSAFGVVSIWVRAGIHSPALALLAAHPLLLALAARAPRPVEACPDHGRVHFNLPELVPFFPFLLLGPVLALALWREGGYVLWPAVTLLAITGLLILRQILLLREIKGLNLDLEARVEARTRELRELQAWQLRYERMNTLALLGAGMIHDLNNALAVVQGSVDLALQETGAVFPAAEKHLHRIRRSTESLADMGHRVMTFARRGIETPQPLDLGQEVRQVEPLLRMLVPRTIRLAVEVEAPLPAVVASRALLEQVLANLVANARDAMPEGGDLRIRVGRGEGVTGGAVVLVSDTGPGIPDDMRERLFTPFFTTKGSGHGTGLGLASSRALMSEVGGDIQLAPNHGSGATFVLTFSEPCAEPMGAPAPEPG